MSVSQFLVSVAKRFEDGPDIDLKLALHCRNYATIALNLEERDAIANAVAAAKRR